MVTYTLIVIGLTLFSVGLILKIISVVDDYLWDKKYGNKRHDF